MILIEDDSKAGLKALYNGTLEEGDDDEEEDSYQGNSEEEQPGLSTILR